MLYYSLTIKKHTYKCRLTAAGCIDLEEELGESPLMSFSKQLSSNDFRLKALLRILHASLQQFNHGLSFDDTCGIYDEYVDEGHGIVDLANVILEIFRASGLAEKKTDAEGDDPEKNG